MTQDELREAGRVEVLSWLRTPYHHMADRKGDGVDCAMLLVRAFANCGLLPATVDPRPYESDWHLHRHEERYLGWLNRYAQLQHDGAPEVLDVYVFAFGRTYSHGAIYVGDGEVVHALKKFGQVALSRLGDSELLDRPSPRRLPRPPLRYRLNQFCEVV